MRQINSKRIEIVVLWGVFLLGLGTGLLKRDGYNGEAEWVVRDEMSKV